MKLLCVTGKKGSGKSIIIGIASRHGIRSLEMHDPVYDEMRRKDIPLTHDNIIRFAEGLRKNRDFGIVARMMLKKIRKEKIKDKMLIICGIRHPDEVMEFRKKYDCLFLAIDADPKIRFRRIMSRARNEDSRTLEQFMKKEQSENKMLGIDKAMEPADITITNNRNMREFSEKLTNLMKFMVKK
jgi:dephospho-CoA kinase